MSLAHLAPGALLAHFRARCAAIEAEDERLQVLVPGTSPCSTLSPLVDSLVERWPEPSSRPPLFGLGLGVKDIIHVDGLPTRCGTALPHELFTGSQAACVTRLLDAGALFMGKTVTTEFASLDPGPTRNPHDPSRTPGGSSSGSAAGVAAGFFEAALGTQTIGSVIRPAAYCGVVGFKPGIGLISNDGIVPFSPTMDQVGLFTRDVVTSVTVAEILLPAIADAPFTIGTLATRLAVPDGPYLDQAARHGLAEFERTVARLELAGVEIARVSALADIAQINQDHQRLVAAELARVHAPWFERYRHLYRPQTLRVIEPGFEVDDGELARLRARQQSNRDAIIGEMDALGVDYWICPPALDSAPQGIGATGNPIMNLPWTHAGLPVLCLPSHLDEERMPHGIQLVARPDADADLLALGAHLESILDYRSPLS